MDNVVVVIGPGQIGQAIARRVGVGSHLVLADRDDANARAAAEVMENAGCNVSTAILPLPLTKKHGSGAEFPATATRHRGAAA